MHQRSGSYPSLNIITLIIGLSCGFLVAGIYYSQPLVGLIAKTFHVETSSSSLIVTLNQLGYGVGLFFIVPLADIVNNKKLILFLVVMAVASLLGFATTQTFSALMAFALFIGLASSAVQILVPYAAYLAPEDRRGSTVGNVMSGLMAGIMLARPFASFLAEFWSWHIVFYVSSAILLFVFFILFLFLPPKIPTSKHNCLSLLLSMVKLWKQHAILRRRATYHAFLFCAFSLFWTTAPLFLMGAPYNFSQGEIALFAFAGAAGIFAAPIAGRLSDKGLFYQATSMAMLLVGICFFLAGLIFFTPKIGVFLLCIAAISLDFGVTTNLVIGQKIIYSLGAEARGRINGLYMVVFFIGGAIGSALGGFIYSRFGWGGIVILGLIITFMVAIYYYTERYAKNS